MRKNRLFTTKISNPTLHSPRFAPHPIKKSWVCQCCAPVLKMKSRRLCISVSCHFVCIPLGLFCDHCKNVWQPVQWSSEWSLALVLTKSLIYITASSPLGSFSLTVISGRSQKWISDLLVYLRLLSWCCLGRLSCFKSFCTPNLVILRGNILGALLAGVGRLEISNSLVKTAWKWSFRASAFCLGSVISLPSTFRETTPQCSVRWCLINFQKHFILENVFWSDSL